ncbi:MAG TPA: TIGR03032 family protein, partial [Pirellulaceae bacterium]
MTDLEGNDRCHLNGIAMDQGQPRFVTMMAESNTPAGWRETKNHSGCVMEIATGTVVSRGLSMPHSPRYFQDRLWVLNSGIGSIETVDLRTGKRDLVTRVPGYTRGLAFAGPVAFVGLSRIRETAVFGGVPIADKLDELKCGVGILDWRSGQQLASLQFESGVEEIFDVQVIPHARCTAICGPRPDQDATTDVWVVPRPEAVEALVRAQRGSGTQRTTPATTPEDVPSLIRRGLALQRERRPGEALEVFARAAELEPRHGEIQNHLGNALQDVGQQDQALECYRRAVESSPQFAPAHQNLGYLLVNRGECDAGREHLRQAQRISPSNVNRIMLATTLPIVYESCEDVRDRRRDMLRDVHQLAEEGVRVDAANSLIPTNFFAVYQGGNDCDLQRDLGRIYYGVDACRSRGRAGGHARRRPKIGFVSAYFRDPTIGRLNLGRI